MRKSIRLQGVYVGTRAMFEDMNRAIAAHKVTPVIDRTIGFDDARDAYRHMKAAGHFGKIVVDIPQCPPHEFVNNIPATRRIALYIDSI